MLKYLALCLVGISASGRWAGAVSQHTDASWFSAQVNLVKWLFVVESMLELKEASMRSPNWGTVKPTWLLDDKLA